jgi:hypothetical protein
MLKTSSTMSITMMMLEMTMMMLMMTMGDVMPITLRGKQ